MTLNDLLRTVGRSSTVPAVAAQTPLSETVGPLVTGTGGNRGHVLVCTGAGGAADPATATVIGSVSEKDYMQKLSHGSFPPKDVTAEQVMFNQLQFATGESRLLSVLQCMLSHGRRHIPVLAQQAAAAAVGSGASAAAGLIVPSTGAGGGVRLGDVSTVVSLREVLAHVSEVEWAAALAGGASEEALTHGVKVGAEGVAAAHGTPSAAAPAAAPAAAAASHAHAAAPAAAAAASPAAATPAAAAAAPAITPLASVGSLLADMTSRGRRILLNTRLDDNLSVADAANVMAERGMSCVAVVDDSGNLVGVFTARDFLTRIAASGQNAASVRVRDVMTQEPFVTTTDRSVMKVARSMIKRGIRHLPIVDEADKRHVVGIVSLADIARPFLTAATATATPAAAAGAAGGPAAAAAAASKMA